MPTCTNPNPDHYLNRLALEKGVNPYSLNPYKVIETFFEYENPAAMINEFRKACRAALSNDYTWANGSAGNLVFFYEQLEMLIEACYLLKVQHRKKKVKKKKQAFTKPAELKTLLPCPLTWPELQQPLAVIEQFFALHSLPIWKQQLHSWMEAGISRYSVTDGFDKEELLDYCWWMEKLLFAAWYCGNLQ